jgi:uncharacterized protein (TIGR02145 family)
MNTRFLFLFLMTACLSVMTIRCKQEKGLGSVTTVAVTDITNTSARCEINVTSDGGGTGDILHDILCSNYIKEPVFPFDPTGGWGGSTGLGTYYEEILDLTPGTIYYVRAYVWNDVGIAYGNTLSFTTTGTVTGDIAFNPEVSYGTVSDIEGNTYKTVQIGNQTWMAENLKTKKLNDGNDIRSEEFRYWSDRTNPAYCWYVNDEAKYSNNYGAMYNWYAVNTGKLCPEGWHVPSDEEWTVLSEYLGGSEVVGHQLQEKGFTHWVESDSAVTNGSGFTALPGGYRFGSGTPINDFNYMGYVASFWSSSTSTQWDNEERPSFWGMAYEPDGTGEFYNTSYWIDKGDGISVRCIKD